MSVEVDRDRQRSLSSTHASAVLVVPPFVEPGVLLEDIVELVWKICGPFLMDSTPSLVVLSRRRCPRCGGVLSNNKYLLPFTFGPALRKKLPANPAPTTGFVHRYTRLARWKQGPMETLRRGSA